MRSSETGFAASHFSDFDRIAKQQNHAKVSLLRVNRILTEFVAQGLTRLVSFKEVSLRRPNADFSTLKGRKTKRTKRLKFIRLSENKIVNLIVTEIRAFRPKEIMTDFEPALRVGIQKALPGTHVRGCK